MARRQCEREEGSESAAARDGEKRVIHACVRFVVDQQPGLGEGPRLFLAPAFNMRTRRVASSVRRPARTTRGQPRRAAWRRRRSNPRAMRTGEPALTCRPGSGIPSRKVSASPACKSISLTLARPAAQCTWPGIFFLMVRHQHSALLRIGPELNVASGACCPLPHLSRLIAMFRTLLKSKIHRVTVTERTALRRLLRPSHIRDAIEARNRDLDGL